MARAILSFTCELELAELIKQRARELGLSESAFISQALRTALTKRGKEGRYDQERNSSSRMPTER